MIKRLKNLQLTIGIDISFPITYKGNQYFFYILRIHPGIKYYSVTVLGWREVAEYPRALFYVGRCQKGYDEFQINMSILWGLPVWLFRFVFPYEVKPWN